MVSLPPFERVAATIPVRIRPRLRALGVLDAAQERSLGELRDPNTDRSVLLQLLETSFLLELSKLASAHLDLATYTQLATDVMVQFLPVDACFLRVDIPDLPAARAAIGLSPLASEDEGDLVLEDVYVGGERVGTLGVRILGSAVPNAAFFATVAEHLSSGLSTVVETERLRGQAAGATALRLAASVPDNDPEEHIEALVKALAALPRSNGAALKFDAPSLGIRLEISEGVVRPDAAQRVVEGIGHAGRGRFLVSWSGTPEDHDSDIFDLVVQTFAGSIDRLEVARQLREDVEIDPLTGVGNRRRSVRALAAALARAERSSEPVAVLAIDLDNFKRINDEFGHPVGDAVLQAFAAGLSEAVRGYDTVVRMGGEEFQVVCPGIDCVSAQSLAKRLRTAAPSWCAAPLPEGWEQTVSIGIAVYPMTSERSEDLLRKADEALYAAKRSGRNTACLA